MPHPRSRANNPPHDDSRSEAGDTRDKLPGNLGNSNSDRRRQTAVAAPNTSDKNPLSSGATNSNGTHAHEGIEGMGWDDIDLRTLHRYRYAYKLPVSSSSTGFNNTVLSTGIGRKSPSRTKLRTSREALATAVRKNFNAQPIQENDVIVNFLYSVKNQDKSFRLRFPLPAYKKNDP